MPRKTYDLLKLLRAPEEFTVFVGRAACTVLFGLFSFVFRALSFPLRFVGRFFRFTGRSVRSGVRRELGEERYFTGRLWRALKTLAASLARSPKTVPALVRYYADRARAVYRRPFRVAALTLLPLCAAGLLLAAVAGAQELRLGLRILSGNTVVAVAASENDFFKAKSEARGRLCAGGNDDGALWPDLSYDLALVRPNAFTDADTLRDTLLRLATAATAPACGVYIDGEFLCAVKNENDARAVFDALLYANADPVATTAHFVQQVRCRQGLYPVNSETLWSRSRLRDYLNALPADRAMHVQVTRTEIETAPLDFQIVEIGTDALDRGERRVLVEGQTGTDQITRLVTLLDGREVGSEVLLHKTLRLPVDARVQVGTRDPDAAGEAPAEEAPGEEAPAESPVIYETYQMVVSYPVYNPDDFGGLLVWPAVGATNLNSDFEYRWGKMHEALDIGTAGAGSSLGKFVVAAAPGTVVIAGIHSSYGYYVKIDHGNGMQTLYAHCLEDSLMVDVGDYVEAGQPIARIGMTGYATGPHLHFEVIINGARVDPKPYLGIG